MLHGFDLSYQSTSIHISTESFDAYLADSTVKLLEETLLA